MDTWTPELTRAGLELWQSLLALLPRGAAALVILLVGWIVARVLRLIVRRLVGRIGRWGSVEQGVKAAGVEELAPNALATIVYWAVFLVTFAAAGQVLGLAVISGVLSRLARYLPSVLSGVVVVIAGVVLGSLARQAVQGAARAARVAHAGALGEVARMVVLAVAAVMALEQFGINSTVLVVALGLAVGGGIGGLAMAFGLGARGAVSNLVAGRQVNRIYRPGQRIRVGAVEGRIVRLDGSSITVDTGEGMTLVPAKLCAEEPSVLLDGGE